MKVYLKVKPEAHQFVLDYLEKEKQKADNLQKGSIAPAEKPANLNILGKKIHIPNAYDVYKYGIKRLGGVEPYWNFAYQVCGEGEFYIEFISSIEKLPAVGWVTSKMFDNAFHKELKKEFKPYIIEFKKVVG